MKIWNRFISFALATTLLLTVPLVSFAAGTKTARVLTSRPYKARQVNCLLEPMILTMVTRFLNSTMMENW